jgi:hypothetical protein
VAHPYVRVKSLGAGVTHLVSAGWVVGAGPVGRPTDGSTKPVNFLRMKKAALWLGPQRPRRVLHFDLVRVGWVPLGAGVTEGHIGCTKDSADGSIADHVFTGQRAQAGAGLIVTDDVGYR